LTFFVLKPQETLLYLNHDPFRVTRAVKNPDKIGATLDPAVKTAMLALAKWTVGTKFWVKENFWVRVNYVAKQYTILYAADQKLAREKPIDGETYLRDGLHSAVDMKAWMSRGLIQLTEVDIVYDRYITPASGGVRAAEYQTGWVWALTFKKAEA
jgi:hypothetical protein